MSTLTGATSRQSQTKPNTRTIMTKQDKAIVVKTLAGALLVIAIMVAAPFAWLALTSTEQEPVASTASVSDLN
jgi:hypothetical protein